MRKLSLLLLITFIFYSCDDNTIIEPIKPGSVSGNIMNVLTSEPATEQIVYLVNLNHNVDTVNYENNKKAFLDSSLTNSEGYYKFNNIPPGQYSVLLKYTSKLEMNSILLAANSDTTHFNMNGNNYNVSFNLLDLSSYGDQNKPKKLKFYIKVINTSKPTTIDYFESGKIRLDAKVRKFWYGPYPFLKELTGDYIYAPYNNSRVFTFEEDMGIGIPPYYVLDNYFKFIFEYEYKDTWGKFSLPFSIDHDWDNCPEESWYLFDFIASLPSEGVIRQVTKSEFDEN